MKKRKLLFTLIPIMLCGCLGDIDGSDNRKEIEQIGIISDNSSETTIISTGWKEEEIYKEITDSCLIDNFCMKRILLMCNYADYENYDALSNIVPTRCFGNWRYCFVLEDGYVYCANIYHDFSPGKEVFYSSMLDELLTDEDKWHELQDIFCIGRVSSVEMQELKSYINNISYNKGYEKSGVLFGKMEKREIYVNAYNADNSKKGWELCRPLGGGILRWDGYECYGDIYSQQIIKWFVDSPYLELWYQHTINTGQKVWNSYDKTDSGEYINITVK